MNKDNLIISIDCETDGLWGNPFAVAAIVYLDGNEIDKICLRLPDKMVKNDWVKEHVLPTLNFPEIYIDYIEDKAEELVSNKLKESYELMLKDFSVFYNKYKSVTALWHMGHICESHLFREMHRLGYIGDLDAPYTPIEVSVYLREINEIPSSVDTYISKYNIKVTDYGSPHNPLYDCEAAFRVYEDIIKKK